ncbi:MAG TPA: cobalt-precorrin 5A hydrolase [Methanospirillum sp.]|nr:cobalt-precorrin 5A hydrolase [Methanospirillum sp.]
MTTHTETVIIALPYLADQATTLAGLIKGRFQPYHDEVFAEAFNAGSRIVAIMAIGIVVRKISPLLKDKWQDPPVVVVSPDIRFAIPVSGGHHGANDLAYELQEMAGLEPVITTATEATGREAVEVIASARGKRVVNMDSTRKANAAVLTGTAGIYTVEQPGMVIATSGVSFLVSDAPCTAGIGCRKGTSEHEIIDAIRTALTECGKNLSDISIYATSTLKLHESGLSDAIRSLEANLIYLDHETLCKEVPESSSAAERFGLPGVAEPAALAVSYRKHLILNKRVYGNVTIAIAC